MTPINSVNPEWREWLLAQSLFQFVLNHASILSRHSPRQEPLQFPRPPRMLQLPHRLRLHLPHPLAGDLEHWSYLFKRVTLRFAVPIPQLYRFSLALG